MTKFSPVLRHSTLAVALALGAAAPAMATEYGSIRALLGAPSYEMTTPAFPGWYGQAWYQYYQADELHGDNGKKTDTVYANVPGLGLVPAQLDVKVRADLYVPRLTYIAEQVLWDGHLGASVTLPIVHQTQDVTLTPQVPAGTPPAVAAGIAQGFAAKASQLSGSATGQADMEVEGFVDWQLEETRVIAGFTVDAPTGSYDMNKSVNPGAGKYWTVSPLLIVSKVWENGLEAGMRATYSFNSPNQDTHVRSGQYLHVDWSALYHFNDQWRAGLQGYTVYQTTNDEGPWVDPSGNKARVYSAGPTVAYLSESGNWALDFKIMQEFEARNRPQGQLAWLRLNFRF